MTRACEASRAGVPTFLPLAVTTMTIVGKFDGAVPVELVRRAAADDPDTAACLGLALAPDEPRRKRRRSGGAVSARKSFVNQVSFRPAAGESGKSAKVFHNGSLHVTGCSSAVDFLEFAHAIAMFVNAAAGAELLLTSARVHMINAGTVVVDDHRRPLRFAPLDLCREAAARGVALDFDPERHPGVKLAVRDAAGGRAATACVFQTGNVSIIGARSPGALADAFEALARVLRECAHVAKPSAGCRTTSKKALEFAHGYPLAAYMTCIS